jgi:hypothetical protein
MIRIDSKATSGEMNYKDEKKHCRRCEIFLLHRASKAILKRLAIAELVS